MANDKVALAKFFTEYMPKQTIVHDALDYVAFATSVGYPNNCGGIGFCVVDKVRSRDMTLFSKFGANRFITLGMLTELVESNNEIVILQEYVRGTDYSICGLADNDVLLHALGFKGLVMSHGSMITACISMNESAIAIARNSASGQGRKWGRECSHQL